MKSPRRILLSAPAVVLAIGLVASCGEAPVLTDTDAGEEVANAASDGGETLDAGLDGGFVEDAGVDGGRIEDAGFDGGAADAGAGDSGTPGGSTGFVPLTELGSGTYKGFEGGLYPGGGNSTPVAHAEVGLSRGQAIAPLDPEGSPDAGGRFVLLSIGMSNPTQEFCSQGSDLPCNAYSFMGQAAADAAVNASTLTLVNGAQGGKSAASWDSSTDPDYDRVRDTRLAPLGLSEKQVQIVWIKVANPGPTQALPDATADAYRLVGQLGDILRAVRIRYPNVKQAFLSSRIYAGYATTNLNPEPYAYESAFAIKWVIQAQMEQMRAGGSIDARAGDLNYDTLVPWVDWGPYLWADGVNPRADGLTYVRADLANDGTHPAPPNASSVGARQKVGRLLLEFFKGSQFTRCWFVSGGSCP